jgi:hypothetical protein
MACATAKKHGLGVGTASDQARYDRGARLALLDATALHGIPQRMNAPVLANQADGVKARIIRAEVAIGCHDG